jgi:hypothetical protein
MYIPAFFSTAANGCPSGYNSYELQHYTITNLNSGARGRLVTNYNKYTNEVSGANFIGLGDWSSFELGNGGSSGIDALRRPYPSLGAPEVPIFGRNFDINVEYYVTGSNGQPITYCYDCTRKYRWTFGSKAGLAAPWQQFANPLGIRVLTNSTGNITNTADYTITTLNFDYTQTGSVEGYGPLWQYDPVSDSAYYIISREDITPTYYNIQNCATSSISASISATSSLSVGNTFKTNFAGLSGSCWNILNSFQSSVFTPSYTNITISQSFADCTTCLDTTAAKYNIINCQTSASYVATFDSNVLIGTTFKINNPFSCFTIQSLASYTSSVDYTTITTSSAFVDCATCLTSSASLQINYLVVGGGGSGGGYTGGGGGAGQFQSSSATLLSATTYPVLIASGGIGAGFKGTNGGSSSFNSTISIGGGAGGAYSDDSATRVGSDGASGGGGVWYVNAAGGTGTAGNNGGAGLQSGQDSGGGGGASTVGAEGSTTSIGGAGKAWIDGNYYAGGGGGYRTQTPLSSNGTGGIGGGGNGTMYFGGTTLRVVTSGSVNTGGGGGGSNVGQDGILGGDGGSGIVKIRYAGSGSAAIGGTITYSGSYTYHTFTASGDFITN